MINKKTRKLAIEHDIEEAKYWISYHKRTGCLSESVEMWEQDLFLLEQELEKLELEEETNGKLV